MRILLITPYFYPHIGGSQQYALELHRHLMMRDKSVKVDVICYNTEKIESKSKYKGMTIYRIPCWDILNGQFAIPNYLELRKLIRKLKNLYQYNIVNSHSRFFDNSWWAPVVAKYLGAKSILTDHASSSPVHNSRLITIISNIVEKLMTNITIRFYDAVTVSNKATMQYIKTFGVKNPILIYGGVDTKIFNPKKRKNVRKIPKLDRIFTKKDIIITFLGRMIYTKGPQIVYNAAKEIIKKYDNVYFIFAGEGNMLAKLNDFPNNKILFTGPLNQLEIANLLPNSDILANPSFHFEGFPNVLLEAGASGCAVIATDRGGTCEVISDEKTGIIIGPSVLQLRNALMKLIDDENLRKRLSTALRKKIYEEFNWVNIAREYQLTLTKVSETKKLKSLIVEPAFD